MARDILTDEQWVRLAPLLPPQKPRTGRPAKDHRTVLEAMLWIVRTGAPWRDLPPEYGPWRSVATRFYRWVRAGVWERVLAELQSQADAEGEIDWRLHHVDGSVVRAHQHAAGAKKGPFCSKREETKPLEEQEALGISRGGFSTKIHLRAEGKGKPIAIMVTAGERHEQSAFEALMDTAAIKRAGRGRPRIRPDRVVGDKGYSGKKIRTYLRNRGIGAVIARQNTLRQRDLPRAQRDREDDQPPQAV